MTFNDFNIKKLIKYVFIAIVCILCFNSCNVKALNYNNFYRINILTGGLDLNDLLYSGNGTDLGDYYHNNFNTDFGNDYVSDVKDYITTTLNYNSFSDFEEDYYYIITYNVYDDNLHGVNHFSLGANCFYVDKEVGTFDMVLTATLSAATPNSSNYIDFGIVPSIDKSLGSTFTFGRLDYNGTYNFVGSTNSFNYSSNWVCYSNYQYCRATRGSDYMQAYLVDRFESYDNKMFFDTNFDFDFIYDSNLFTPQSNYYYFEHLTINDTETIYNFGDKIAGGNGNIISVIRPNISDLGNNSYAINLNTIYNNFYDYTNNITTTIGCPFDRDFTGNVCYLYDTDIENYDNTNTLVNNNALFNLSGLVNFDGSKYYALSFRIYSPYDVGVELGIYHLSNDNTDYNMNIQSMSFKDYTLYKDIVLVFYPNHNGEMWVHDIDLTFSYLNNYTDEISSNYSFGIFKTIKISQYDTLPTNTDLQNELNNNNLTTISNNSLGSFFTNFHVNDFGLSSIILLPLNYINSLSNYSCSSLTLPIPKIGNVSLPCISTFMSTNFNSIWVIFKLIINGFIVYRVCINIFYTIKNAYKPDNDKLEVLDL